MTSPSTPSRDTFVPLTPDAAAPGSGQVALVPGTDVPVLRLDLPDTLRGRAREQVARHQLQDLTGLGEAVEMRPLVGGQGADSWDRVLVSDSAQLAAWRALAGEAPQAVLPDYLSLPASEALWCIEETDGMVRARLGTEDAFSAERELAMLMLRRALKETEQGPDRPRAVLLLGGALEGLEALLEGRDIPLLNSIDALEEMGLDAPKRLAHGELEMDLRNDPWAALQRLRRRVLIWRLPLAIGVLAVGFWAATQMLETRRLTAQAARVQETTLALVRTHFVPSGPVLDIRTQVARALAARHAEAAAQRQRVSPLILLGTAVEVIAAQGGQGEQISFDADTGTRMVVRLADFGAVDRLIPALQAEGLVVTLQEARSEDGSKVRVVLDLAAGAGEAGE